MNLWNFALALYARPGIEEACLNAQQTGANVCLLLCGAWLERRGAGYQPACAQALCELAAERQATLIAPLRNVRQQLRHAARHKPQLAQLYEQVKELELAAERQLLEQLERLCLNWPDAPTPATSAWLESLTTPLAVDHRTLALLRSHSAAIATGPAEARSPLRD